jgi:hypothetical protein
MEVAFTISALKQDSVRSEDEEAQQLVLNFHETNRRSSMDGCRYSGRRGVVHSETWGQGDV